MKIVVFTYVRNEAAYVARNVVNSLEQGLVPVMIDNGSTDGTDTLARSLGIPLHRHMTPEFVLHDMISYGVELSQSMGADWYVLKDADELMESYDDRTVARTIEDADAEGYNCVNFDSYSFWPTTSDNWSEPDYARRQTHYTFFDIPYVRAIKNSPEIWLDHPHLPGGERRQSPTNLVIRHYKFLDPDHGRRKVAERRQRYAGASRAAGSHTHYDHVGTGDGYFVLGPEISHLLSVWDGHWIREQVWDEWRR